MRWEDDVEVGSWIRDRLDPGFATMHGVVPRGFAAYARVFHPAGVRSMPDGPVATNDELDAMDEEQYERTIASFRDRTASWAEVAALFGATMHPLAQWNRIVRTPEGEDWRRRRSPDGSEVTAPTEGELPPETLTRVAERLTAHTSTPEDGVAGVWEGWGGLLGGYGTTGRVFFGTGDDAGDPHAAMLAESIHDPFNNPYQKAPWQDGILSREISEGVRLELPDRAHVLFTAPPRVFADPDWMLRVPWRDTVAEEHGFPPRAQHPSLIWPADRAWILVSEIDFDSTIVGGPAALIEALCADPRIEALPIPEGADLQWDADGVNA
ncbi:MAG: hypothetical protein JST25_14310 [Actinobacteria bacterium]|nr:hypothetical protein [Actinomycetota bacterium]